MKLRFLTDGDWARGLLVLLLLVFVIVLGPLLIIWSLNTLFPALAIPFTFYTWLATAILLIFASSSTVRSSDQ
jgi:hypothetical protein